ncbi:MAG: DUF3147 family protein [Candidatus Sulfotelmatobacter sp.]
MKVKIDTSELGQSRWQDYLLRFLFGGTVTALAGVIAKRFGPGIGGLFLAFPAILPAAATLIEKHEKQKKDQARQDGAQRGQAAAGIDAAGASMGCIGLVAFAFVVWKELPHFSAAVVLSCATLAWLVISVSLWQLRETLWRRLRVRLFTAPNHRLHPSVHNKSSSPRRFDE